MSHLVFSNLLGEHTFLLMTKTIGVIRVSGSQAKPRDVFRLNVFHSLRKREKIDTLLTSKHLDLLDSQKFAKKIKTALSSSELSSDRFESMNTNRNIREQLANTKFHFRYDSLPIAILVIRKFSKVFHYFLKYSDRARNT